MTTLRELLERGKPDAAAIVAPGRRPLSYADLRRTVTRLVAQLRDAGVSPGDRVAIVLPGGPDLAVTFLAVAACAAAAPLNPRYREDEFRFYLGDLEAKALITLPNDASPATAAAPASVQRLSLVGEGPELELAGPARRPAGHRQDPNADDVALVLHTSGTTSRPKIVPLRHRHLVTSAGNVASALALTAADRGLTIMPLFHIHGLVAGLLAPLWAGGSVACPPGFDAFQFFSWMDELRPTWYTAVPSMHQAILARAGRHADALGRARLRFVRSSSAPLPTRVLDELTRLLGVPVVEAYGMTEAAHQIASNPLPPGPRKPGSVGMGTGVEVAIMGEAGRLLGAGEIGEVVLKGATIISAYHANPEADAAAYAGGWFRTGDRGYLDADGYLFLTGRLKELINRGGEKIAPLEVDEVLLRHPSVAQAVAFAVPHATLGEEVGAAVVLAEGRTATERELRDFVASRLADFKVPRTIVFVSELPKGPTGKLQRIGLARVLGLAGPG